jgi:hypothetical protein
MAGSCRSGVADVRRLNVGARPSTDIRLGHLKAGFRLVCDVRPRTVNGGWAQQAVIDLIDGWPAGLHLNRTSARVRALRDDRRRSTTALFSAELVISTPKRSAESHGSSRSSSSVVGQGKTFEATSRSGHSDASIDTDTSGDDLSHRTVRRDSAGRRSRN